VWKRPLLGIDVSEEIPYRRVPVFPPPVWESSRLMGVASSTVEPLFAQPSYSVLVPAVSEAAGEMSGRQ